MSSRVPILKSAELLSLLERHGFVKIAQEGSHVKMRNGENITLIIPVHKGKDMKKGLVAAILRQADISVETL